MKLAEIPKKQITIALAILLGGLIIALLIGFLSGRPLGVPTVVSTEPADGQENFLGEVPVAVTFKDDLTEKQQDAVYFEFQPEAFFTVDWISNRRVEATLIQPLALELNTTYTVEVLYNGKPIHSFTFKTPSITEEQLTQDIIEQTEGDELFAEAQEAWYKANPWYSQLPIVKDDYTIVYESDAKRFRIRLTLADNALPVQIESAKKRALEDLEATGVDLNKYSYYYLEE